MITNCRLLGEGVDYPELELVVMADGTTSSVDARQRIGRVSRKAPGKECGYVLVPMTIMDGGYVVDHYDDDDDINNNRTVAFKNFISVFQAMVGEDPKLKQDVLFVMNELSTSNGQPLRSDQFPARFLDTFELPSSWSFKMKIDLMNKIVVEFKNDGINRWNRMFELLLSYKNRTGNCYVPRSYTEKSESLGMWVSKQRNAKAKGYLSSERIKQLDSIDMVWNAIDQKWEDMFALLMSYKERTGNCNVPNRHNEENGNLGIWVGTQRKAKINGFLSSEKIKQLNSIDMAWNAFDQKWEDMFALLEHYHAREGHCNVPGRHKEENENLGSWLGTQRRAKRNGFISRERIKRLDSIGMIWNVIDQKWEDMFALLVQYETREGDCDLPGNHKEENENIGTWVQHQRAAKTNGILSSKRIKQLNSIDMVWNTRDQQWEDMFALLVQYNAREGHCKVPFQHTEENKNLGIWVGNQRKAKKKGKLDPKRRRKLDDLGIQWERQ